MQSTSTPNESILSLLASRTPEMANTAVPRISSHIEHHGVLAGIAERICTSCAQGCRAASRIRGPGWVKLSSLRAITGTLNCGRQKSPTCRAALASPGAIMTWECRISTCSRLTCGQGTWLSAKILRPPAAPVPDAGYKAASVSSARCGLPLRQPSTKSGFSAKMRSILTLCHEATRSRRRAAGEKSDQSLAATSTSLMPAV